MRLWTSITCLGLVAAASADALIHRVADTPASDWEQISWPFPRDAWPEGLAFRCRGRDCEGDIISVRTKVGFCNCATGVADDAEVDGVADIDLWSHEFVAKGPGERVEIGGLAGRMRRYSIRADHGSARDVIGIALSHGCDLVAATVGSAPGVFRHSHLQADAVLASERVTNWVEHSLGGR